MTPLDIIWRPHAGTNQERFLQSSAREAFFAGEANSGKSAAMLAAPLRWMHLPGYSAIILRRTWPAIRDSLLPKVFELYPRCGGQPHEGGRLWTWENGGKIRFTSMERAEDRFQFKSQEHEFIGFEELDTFEEVQYTYLLSRNRTSRLHNGKRYPLRIRANANPGGPGTSWIVRRWGPWIYQPPTQKRDPKTGALEFDKQGCPVMAPHPDTPPDFVGPFVPPGTKLWAVTDPHTGHRRYVAKGEVGDDGEPSISTVFFASRLDENLSVDPAEYRATLAMLDPLSREQLGKGNWFARAKAGAFFNRQWVEYAASPPPDVTMRVRVWDRAATEPSAQNKDPDWTAGALMSLSKDGFIWLEDMVRMRGAPGDVEKCIVSTAELDATRKGTPTAVGLLHDPGSAGKFEMASYVKHAVLARNQIIPIQVHKDKVTMGKPFSAAANNHRVRVVLGPWNQACLGELEGFPEEDHDDQWDAIANGYRVLHGLHGGVSSSSGGADQKRAAGVPSMHRNTGAF